MRLILCFQRVRLEVTTMKEFVRLLFGIFLVLGLGVDSDAAEQPSREPPAAYTPPVPEQVRKELLEARATAWGAFFQKDQKVLEEILAPELIAIQQHADRWEDRTRLMKMAKAMNEQGARVLRLEFPRTEIQLFGDTAILYYTYVFEMAIQGRVSLDAGRGTEVFVRRGGKWVDAGWHLDNGAFVRNGEQWVRVGEPLPAPSSAPSRMR
jgi:Domain of unknown function (DUF4440)